MKAIELLFVPLTPMTNTYVSHLSFNAKLRLLQVFFSNSVVFEEYIHLVFVASIDLDGEERIVNSINVAICRTKVIIVL